MKEGALVGIFVSVMIMGMHVAAITTSYGEPLPASGCVRRCSEAGMRVHTWTISSQSDRGVCACEVRP